MWSFNSISKHKPQGYTTDDDAGCQRITVVGWCWDGDGPCNGGSSEKALETRVFSLVVVGYEQELGVNEADPGRGHSAQRN